MWGFHGQTGEEELFYLQRKVTLPLENFRFFSRIDSKITRTYSVTHPVYLHSTCAQVLFSRGGGEWKIFLVDSEIKLLVLISDSHLPQIHL